ncbi:hypothetical protein N0V88_000231 [Collariella sp. IMI 366227]|nr:hypothetical protein N0V88_000231 [Collariella sp. IMI 366227]
MDTIPRKMPRQKNDRVILHFCVENKHPSLKSLPLGIKQKGILATCNYVARRLGVKKLMPIAEAKKICPALILADGEDLSPFRDVSKRLYALLRSYSWNGKVERLGLDEVFLDVTDMVSYNVELLNRNALPHSFFCLSRADPEIGFEFDATSFAGCLLGKDEKQACENSVRMRLLLASHLARYLRGKIEDEGYTTACGIATNKLLAKLVGDNNKPRNQTSLLALHQQDVLSFMDAHRLRKVPGIGGKTTRILEGFVLGKEPDTDIYTMECSTTVGEVRAHPSISPPNLDRLLSGPGSEKGLGAKVWSLLHGVDETDVKPARDVPTQISIEDTYKGLNEPHDIQRALRAITASLLRRMYIDLVEDLPFTTFPPAPTISNPSTQNSPQLFSRKWLAHPKTLRLTTRPYTHPSSDKPYNFARASRSCPLPSFVFTVSTNIPTINTNNNHQRNNANYSSTSNIPSLVLIDQLAEKLVTEALLPLFYKLNPGRRGWNIGLLNVCVTNMGGEW